MIKADKYIDEYNPVEEMVRYARIQTTIPTIPIYPIPTACMFNGCYETPAFTMNGQGLCKPHFHEVIESRPVKIRAA